MFSQRDYVIGYLLTWKPINSRDKIKKKRFISTSVVPLFKIKEKKMRLIIREDYDEVSGFVGLYMPAGHLYIEF